MATSSDSLPWPFGADRGGIESILAGVRDYAIFLLDHQGRVLTWNSGAKAIKGYDADEVVGRHISLFYTPEDAAARRPERLLRVAAEEGRVEDEGWRVRKDGTRFWADVVISAITDASGAVIGYSKVTRDLTERRQMEGDLARQAIEQARAEEAVRERDVFLSIAAHELRTPITAFKLKLEGIAKVVESKLEGRAAGEIIGKRVNDALRHVDRIDDLVERLLDVSRVANRTLDMRYESVDLAPLVATAVEDQQDNAAYSDIALRFRASGDCVGSWDRRRMEQVVLNLVSNAIKYGDGKPVDVVVEGGPAEVRIAVTDHGIGIDKSDLERIFHPFERAAPVQHYPGLGLGLYVARRIVEAHGGSLDVISDPATGTVFTVVVPKSQG